MAFPLVIPVNMGAGPATSASDPFFGSLLSGMDSSGWTVNFGDGSTQSATAGDRGGQSLSNQPTKATSPYPINIPSNAGGIGTPAQLAGGAGIPWNLVYLFGGAAALILLWKR